MPTIRCLFIFPDALVGIVWVGWRADEKLIVEGIKASEKNYSAEEDHYFCRTLFANSNQFDLLKGYEGVRHIVSSGGRRGIGGCNYDLDDGRMRIVKIAPILKNSNSRKFTTYRFFALD